ncbi:MAG TPA: hypothetical protein DCS07_18205 [Bdellovibrionales bacterium]|nr:MAG: hypothetical protein A2Z97_01880 [Bdellovibrionales bacterium GWB1_52_6]OFZ04906.1 MAG: hypothetical protein A2X97_16195 [Bdellovibrionales bacterium GWA1_52_35]OFZ40431.1 MAG: hypothetical protein A2070_02195 [Bdellovibrionales bacterium GWC1_52_8]HAR44536.1 hypothetical protein [Bdellovibrionales bacterium]HCM38838.1 hypothetical protein [Bdellovibrionales bacterium]
MRNLICVAGVIVAVLLSSQSALARGGWISSGGEIYRNEKNPWFVGNTKIVRYCVAVDPLSVSADPAHVESLITASIVNWKREFQKYYDAELFSEFQVASQEFIQVPCAENPDLKFQLGWGSLDSRQQAYIVEQGAESILGLAVRTDYDEVQLRGKGFIYIASDLGAHRYDGGADTVEAAWQYDALLYYVISHEFGHVLGVPHVGADHFLDTSRFMMAEQFPEYILRKAAIDLLKQMPGFDLNRPNEFTDFFVLSRNREQCKLGAYPIKWFGLPKEATCVRLNRLDSKNYLVFARGPSMKETLVGQIQVSSTRTTNDSLLTLYLDPSQAIFPHKGPWPTLFGPGFAYYTVAGIYVPVNGQSKAVSVSFDEKLIIMGEDNGQMTFVLR